MSSNPQKPNNRNRKSRLAVAAAAHPPKNRVVQKCCRQIRADVEQVITGAKFFRTSPVQPTARLARHEIRTGRMVGKGGFSVVLEVTMIRLDPSFDAQLPLEMQRLRQHVASNCLDERGHCRYVIKHLHEKLLQSPSSSSSSSHQPSHYHHHQQDWTQIMDRFASAASDLIIECAYLQRLDHPHIVRLMGMPMHESGVQAYAKEGQCDSFFMLLERVEFTIDDALQHELCQQRKEQLLLHPHHHHQQQQHRNRSDDSKQRHLLLTPDDKLELSLQLAQALAYLHSNQIVFRDLKPQNVGIVANDNEESSEVTSTRKTKKHAVLLDFGLCREIPLNSPSLAGGLYRMSAVGTRRYMAVEVFNSGHYNEKADCYSFGIVVWEWLTLTRPFAHYHLQQQHALHVCVQGERPDVSSLTREVQNLLSQSWTEDVRSRLDMHEIVALLSAIIRSRYYERELLTNSDNNSSSSSSPIQIEPHSVVNANENSRDLTPSMSTCDRNAQEEVDASSCTREDDYDRGVTIMTLSTATSTKPGGDRQAVLLSNNHNRSSSTVNDHDDDIFIVSTTTSCTSRLVIDKCHSCSSTAASMSIAPSVSSTDSTIQSISISFMDDEASSSSSSTDDTNNLRLRDHQEQDPPKRLTIDPCRVLVLE